MLGDSLRCLKSIYWCNDYNDEDKTCSFSRACDALHGSGQHNGRSRKDKATSRQTAEDQKSAHLRLRHGPKNTTSFMSDSAALPGALLRMSLPTMSIPPLTEVPPLSLLSDDVLRGGDEITDDELAERLAARMGLVGA